MRARAGLPVAGRRGSAPRMPLWRGFFRGLTRLLPCACLLAFGAGAGQAASFDCAAASRADERAICATPGLNDQDVRMATLYEVLSHLLGMGARGALHDEQQDWLRTRAACGADVACLNGAYARRIATLEQGLKAIYSRGPY